MTGLQIRYSAICLHLDNDRGDINQKGWDRNRETHKENVSLKHTWTDFGIKK